MIPVKRSMLRVISLILGAANLSGCVALDGRINSYNRIISSPEKFNGVFANKATYCSSKFGLLGPGNFADAVGFYQYNGTPDFIALQFNHETGLNVRLVKDGKVIFKDNYQPPNDLTIMADGRLLLKRRHIAGSGDGPGIGYGNAIYTLFTDTDDNLGVIQSGGGFGLIGIFPFAMYARLMSIFPRSSQQITFEENTEIDTSLLQDYTTALVIRNRSTGEVTDVNPERSAHALPPCSTFKIYNTLIGLELGLLKGPDEQWYKWDGIPRDIAGWNQDLTLREAFRVSAVPAFQILARQIGPDRMKEYVERINYGTKDTSAGIDVFWLPKAGRTSILISANEQVKLLNQLLEGQLPFSQENILTFKDIMRVTTTEKGTLYGKTGSGSTADGKLGWFVGFLESKGTTYVFACNITGGTDPSGKAARSIVEDIFKSNGLL